MFLNFKWSDFRSPLYGLFLYPFPLLRSYAPSIMNLCLKITSLCDVIYECSLVTWMLLFLELVDSHLDEPHFSAVCLDLSIQDLVLLQLHSQVTRISERPILSDFFFFVDELLHRVDRRHQLQERFVVLTLENKI